MNRKEFADRTNQFLTDEEIARYEYDYEPAYMACDFIDKDDFCAILRDEKVRKVIIAFSLYATGAQSHDQKSAALFNDMVAQRDDALARVGAYRKWVALIQATCDRALAADGKVGL